MVVISKLARAVVGNRQRLIGATCSHINSQTRRWVTTINYDRSLEHGFLIPNINIKDTGVSSLIGKRKKQEDRLTITSFKDGTIFLGIFDGHGGSLAATYTEKHLPTIMEDMLDTAGEVDSIDFAELMEKAFLEVSANLLQYVRKSKAESERYSGTTATVCLLQDNLHLHTASVGDSRAILCRRGNALPLTDDQNPGREDEKLRIEREGGIIVSNSIGEPLVNGRLAMTRSIGDFDLKPYGVTAKPEYTYKQLKHSSDSFLVLITDGVTFSMNNQEVVNLILAESTPQLAADQVTEFSIQLRSQDNSTAIVLPLGAWGRYEPPSTTIMNEFGRSLTSRD